MVVRELSPRENEALQQAIDLLDPSDVLGRRNFQALISGGRGNEHVIATAVNKAKTLLAKQTR